MSDEVSAALRRMVRERAGGRCEYCCMPDSEPVYPHEPDHIIALKHGGPTTSDNLAYACFECNRAKGSDIASLDPDTGTLTPLYHPRTQQWSEHFHFAGAVIEPLTAVGRVTVFVLRLNQDARVAIRTTLLQAGRYPQPDSSE
jgi:hypothetical protein